MATLVNSKTLEENMNQDIGQMLDDLDDIEDDNYTDHDDASDAHSIDSAIILDITNNNQPNHVNTFGGQSSSFMSEQERQDLYASVNEHNNQIEALIARNTEQKREIQQIAQKTGEVIEESQMAIRGEILRDYSAAKCVIGAGVLLNILGMGSAILVNMSPKLALSLGITVFNFTMPLFMLGLAFLFVGMFLLRLANQTTMQQNLPPRSTYQMITNCFSRLFSHQNARVNLDDNENIDALRL